MNRMIEAGHGMVCRREEERKGYFGWPTVARLDDGTLVVAASGFRSRHVCPYGKTVLCESKDEGKTWSEPRVIQNSLIDDRDGGLLSLGNGRVLVSWFRSLGAQNLERCRKRFGDTEVESWADDLAPWTEAAVAPLIGSWLMLSDDAGKTWSEPFRAPVSAPHGPIRLANGDILYLGIKKDSNYPWDGDPEKKITAARSRDGGYTWELVGSVPVPPGIPVALFSEPHAVELPSGRIIGLVRIDDRDDFPLEATGIPDFSLLQTESDDGGKTWATLRPLGFHGAPAHLLRHSSGTLILAYSYRKNPYGQRIAFSRDDGASWDHDWILRDDGPSWDLGYPSTVELPDGSLFSVYYQQVPPDTKCSILWSRWRLPEGPA